MINQLGYVIVYTRSVSEWRALATSLAGLQAIDSDDRQVVRLRMDSRCQRILVASTDMEPSIAMGFEVSDATGLSAICGDLAKSGVVVKQGTAAEIELRAVDDMVHFQDPDGNRVEIAFGAKNTTEPFVPGRPTGGFVTGDLGLGHVALKAGRFDEMCRLYRDTLGFRVSDRATVPFPCEFLHVNARHHSLGLADTGTGAGVYHLMLEYKEWDDVGRAHDLALEQPDAIGVSLGRHANDHVTSFYVRTPDGWMLELGWAGRLIGNDWEVTELPGLSLWGHDRSWLPPAKRAEARELLRTLASQGLRAPVVPPRSSQQED